MYAESCEKVELPFRRTVFLSIANKRFVFIKLLLTSVTPRKP